MAATRKPIRGLQMPTLLAAAVGAHQHARRIEAAAACHADLRRAHADLRPLADFANQSLQPSRLRSGVVVQGGDEGPFGGADALIHGGAEPGVLVVRDDSDALSRLGELMPAVVYHDHFKIAKSLARQRFQARLEGLAGGERWNHYRNAGRTQNLILIRGGWESGSRGSREPGVGSRESGVASREGAGRWWPKHFVLGCASDPTRRAPVARRGLKSPVSPKRLTAWSRGSGRRRRLRATSTILSGPRVNPLSSWAAPGRLGW